MRLGISQNRPKTVEYPLKTNMPQWSLRCGTRSQNIKREKSTHGQTNRTASFGRGLLGTLPSRVPPGRGEGYDLGLEFPGKLGRQKPVGDSGHPIPRRRKKTIPSPPPKLHRHFSKHPQSRGRRAGPWAWARTPRRTHPPSPPPPPPLLSIAAPRRPLGRCAHRSGRGDTPGPPPACPLQIHVPNRSTPLDAKKAKGRLTVPLKKI